jgi:hypothetical protein
VISAPATADAATEARADACSTLTVEQYAALCAELAVAPGSAENIFQRYGLGSPRERPQVDDDFAQRFRVDPALEQRWQALVAHYREWFRTRGA